MTPSGGGLTKFVVAAVLVIVVLQLVQYLLACYGTQICILVVLGIIARIVWSRTSRW